MINFIDLLTNNVPPHKPARGTVRTVTMEGSRMGQNEKLKVAARLRAATGAGAGTAALIERKLERKAALLAKLKEVGSVDAVALSEIVKYSETNTRYMLRELLSEGKVAKVKIGTKWYFKVL